LGAGAGIGRQAWLRAMCRKAWRFKSSPAHSRIKSPFLGIFHFVDWIVSLHITLELDSI